MNWWLLFVTNCNLRRDEREARWTLLLGDSLLDAIRDRWVPSAHKP